METSVIGHDFLSLPRESYIYVMPLPEVVKTSIYHVQQQLTNEFGGDAFWFAHGEQLHVTVAHIISPDGNYSQNVSDIYQQVRGAAQTAFETALTEKTAPNVVFDTVTAFPAAIIIQGHDDGTIKTMRDRFVSKITLPAGTRKPPDIIHATIARFLKPLPFGDVERFIANNCQVNISAVLDEIRLVSERKIFLQDFVQLATYTLPSAT